MFSDLFLPSPVNRSHEVTRGLTAWWFCVPNRARGMTWFDLCRALPAVLANITPHSNWSQLLNGRADPVPGFSNEIRTLLLQTGSSQYAECSTPAFTGLPCSIAASFRVQTLGASYAIASVSAGTSRVQLTTDSTNHINASSVTSGGTAVAAQSSTTHVLNQWQQGVAVFGSSTSREIFSNGISRGTNTTSNVTGSFTRTVIGARYASGSPGAYFDGRIIDCMFWNRALTTDDVRELYAQYRRGYPDMLRRRRPITAKAGAAATAAAYARFLSLLGCGS